MGIKLPPLGTGLLFFAAVSLLWDFGVRILEYMEGTVSADWLILIQELNAPAHWELEQSG